VSARRRTAAARPAAPRPARRAAPSGAAAVAAPPAVDMTVRIGPMTLRNPVLTASGTFGYGDEFAHVVDLAAIGGVITKTVTVHPREGNPPVRIAETAGGMLNSIGLENVGLARFQAEKVPKLRALGATIVASVGGETPAELERLVRSLAEEPGIAGFEINFSCPNVAAGGARYWAVPRRLERTVAQLRRLTTRCLIAKLSPDVTSVGDLAKACEAGGADAVTAVNTFVGMALDLEHMTTRLARRTGGLSGPAIKPLALARCAEAARAVRIPVIGSGGMMDGRDALEFIAVGASAVQVGTASFIHPRAAQTVAEQMAAWLAARGWKRLDDFRGCLTGADAQACTPPAPRVARDRRAGGKRT
jgi:dihydroorotate dehydrogenase (NAD+) catalytic subunit